MGFELQLAKTSSEVMFLYDTRTHPKIDKMLSGNPPENIDIHKKYIEKVQSKSKFIYVAYLEKDMVGYSQVYDIQDSTVEVGFAVHPDHQGKGLGKKLVDSTILKCKENFPDKGIVLYVKEDNLKAISIYEKYNFKKKSLEEGLFLMELIKH
jgi:ribosomal protein S18 acetylase RimI-like enzyme